MCTTARRRGRTYPADADQPARGAQLSVHQREQQKQKVGPYCFSIASTCRLRSVGWAATERRGRLTSLRTAHELIESIELTVGVPHVAMQERQLIRVKLLEPLVPLNPLE